MIDKNKAQICSICIVRAVSVLLCCEPVLSDASHAFLGAGTTLIAVVLLDWYQHNHTLVDCLIFILALHTAIYRTNHTTFRTEQKRTIEDMHTCSHES